jgi:hypothetical protein
MGLDVLYQRDLANHAKGVKTAHDSAMNIAQELRGDEANLKLLAAYDRGFYACLIALQAAAGNQPRVLAGHTVEQVKKQTAPLLGASATRPLSEIIVDFVKVERHR